MTTQHPEMGSTEILRSPDEEREEYEGYDQPAQRLDHQPAQWSVPHPAERASISMSTQPFNNRSTRSVSDASATSAGSNKPLPSIKFKPPPIVAPSIAVDSLPTVDRDLPPTPQTPPVPTPPKHTSRGPSPAMRNDSPLPPTEQKPVWQVEAERIASVFDEPYFMLAAVVAVVLALVTFGWHLLYILGLIAAPFIARYILPPLEKDKRASENTTGTSDPSQSDSVAWVNHALRSLFPLISTDVLTPFIDLLEDALIQQVPPIVTSVRLSSVSLGTEPVQLTSMRPISDDEWFAALAESSDYTRSRPVSQEYADKASSGVSASNSDRAPSRSASARKPPPLGHSPGLSSEAPTQAPSSPASQHSQSVPVPVVHPVPRSHQRHPSTASRLSAALRSEPHGHDRVPSQVSSPQPGMSPLAAQQLRRRTRLLKRLRRRRSSNAVPAPGSAALREEQDDFDADQFVNYEVAFSYRRTADMRAKASGLHMIAHFGWGVKGVGGSEIPVYLDVAELRGMLRVRIQLSASPPFAREVSFSFVSMPEFDISARPLRSGSFNAMDIRPIKSYVEKSIARVAGGFVAPKSYTMDVDRLLLGHESSLRTSTMGVFHIIIHSATGLPRTDTVGECDPYLSISYAKFNKPLFSTRTIVSTLDPVWEEEGFILVPSDAISVGEKLRLRVCDSDRFSADDLIGVIEKDVADIVEQSEGLRGTNNMLDKDEALAAAGPGMKVQGKVQWSIRFYPLWQMPPEELDKRLESIKDKRGEGSTPAPPWLQWLDKFVEVPDWEREREQRRKDTVAYFTGERMRDEMEAAGKPNPDLPSGVLQFHIHQCADLEVESLQGTFSGQAMSRRKSAASGKPALQDVIDRTAADNVDPPNAYCEVHINDKFVYRTRTKQLTPVPYFNAVSERFVRDWRTAKIVFVVKDARDREHDPILGVVALRLKDVLKDSCQVTHWFPIIGGLGWGRLRISLLFKAFDMPLPSNVSSYETATFDLASLTTTNDLVQCSDNRAPRLVIESEYDRAVMKSGNEEDNAASTVNLEKSPKPRSRRSTISKREKTDGEVEWHSHRPVRLAVMYRHSCSLVFSFTTKRMLKKSKVHVVGTLRLNDCPDGELHTRVIPLFATTSVRDAMKAAQKFADMQAAGSLSPLSNQFGVDAQIVGYARVSFVMHPGISRAHHRLAKRDRKFRSVYDAWEATRIHDGAHEEFTSEDDEDEDSLDSDDGASAAAARLLRDDEREMHTQHGAHNKALHKRNRGIFQLKLARTGKYVKDQLETKLLSSSNGMDRRPHGTDLEVEHEGQSKL